MKCLLCKHVRRCQFEADYMGQVFDVNYDGEHGCADFTLMTNADRIRSLSDEELAEWIYSGVSTDPCDYCKQNTLHCDGSPCRGKADAETIVAWLKKPYGGADHERA